MDKIIVTLTGIAGIIFTYWFFLRKKDEAVIVTDSVNITVEGGYNPNTIEIPKGKPTKITFTRRDPNDCLSEVVLGDFKIRRELPLNKPVTIEIIPRKAGTFTYSCGMNMYHGKIIVK